MDVLCVQETRWRSDCRLFGAIGKKYKLFLMGNEARGDGVLDGSGISWTLCKQSAPCSRQITTPIPHHSLNFYRPDALPDTNQRCQNTEGTEGLLCNNGNLQPSVL